MSDAQAHIDQDKREPSMEEILATIRRIIAEDEQKTATKPENSGHAGAPDDNVLVLTEAVNDDGSIRHIEPTASEGTAPLSAERTDPEPPRSDVPAEPPAPVERALRTEQRLSGTASGLAAAALARQAERERRGADIPLGGGDKTLEDIVREMLQPMLQAWLDENLPRIVAPVVERLARAEVRRVAADANTR